MLNLDSEDSEENVNLEINSLLKTYMQALQQEISITDMVYNIANSFQIAEYYSFSQIFDHYVEWYNLCCFNVKLPLLFLRSNARMPVW